MRHGGNFPLTEKETKLYRQSRAAAAATTTRKVDVILPETSYVGIRT
jgi:23S rRNA maturation mini-RNase III